MTAKLLVESASQVMETDGITGMIITVDNDGVYFGGNFNKNEGITLAADIVRKLAAADGDASALDKAIELVDEIKTDHDFFNYFTLLDSAHAALTQIDWIGDKPTDARIAVECQLNCIETEFAKAVANKTRIRPLDFENYCSEDDVLLVPECDTLSDADNAVLVKNIALDIAWAIGYKANYGAFYRFINECEGR